MATRAMSRGVPVTSAMLTQFVTLTPDEHVDTAVETLLRTSQSEFPVVDGANRPIGVLGRGDLIRALRERGPDARVADVITIGIPTVEQEPMPARMLSACCRKKLRRPWLLSTGVGPAGRPGDVRNHR